MHPTLLPEIGKARHQEAIARAERYRRIQMARRRKEEEESPRTSLRTPAYTEVLKWAGLSSVVVAAAAVLRILH